MHINNLATKKFLRNLRLLSTSKSATPYTEMHLINAKNGYGEYEKGLLENAVISICALIKDKKYHR